MKRLILVFVCLIVIIGVGIGIYLISTSTSYKIIATKLEENSPDLVLKVYDKNNVEIDYKSISYLDGIILCESKNPTINKFDVKDNEKLIVMLENGEQVKAIVEMEDDVWKN